MLMFIKPPPDELKKKKKTKTKQENSFSKNKARFIKHSVTNKQPI